MHLLNNIINLGLYNIVNNSLYFYRAEYKLISALCFFDSLFSVGIILVGEIIFSFIQCFLFYCFFIFGFANNAAIYPKNTAAAIPPAEDFTPPIKAPSNPCSLADSIAP